MKEPKKLTVWDFPNTELIADGYDMTSVPKMSDENFRVLINAHNELVETINFLCGLNNINFDT